MPGWALSGCHASAPEHTVQPYGMQGQRIASICSRIDLSLLHKDWHEPARFSPSRSLSPHPPTYRLASALPVRIYQMQAGDGNVTWKLQIKHGAQTLEVALPPSATVDSLQVQLQELTGAFVRKQKLIHKGKVLATPKQQLSAAGLADGAKIMLMVTADSGSATIGQQAAMQQKKQKQDEAAARVRELYAQAKGPGIAAAAAAPAPSPTFNWSDRKSNWQRTGIISLRDLGLRQELTVDLFVGLGAAKLADLSHNQLSRLPPSLASLSSLHTLRLSHNALTAEGVPWAALASLSALTCLTLDHNPLGPGPGHTHTAPASTSAPASGGATASTSTPTITQSPGPSQPQRQQAADGPTAAAGTGEGTEAPAAATEGCAAGPCWSLAPGLVQLDVSHCGLAALPRGVGALAALEALAADGNALQELPEELGCCSSLQSLSAEGNRIRALPPALARLGRLQVLRLDDNRIASLPPGLLSGCSSLWSLSLQGNPITADQLRSTPGFPEYDARRVLRCNKQLEAGVLAHAARTFTEGAEQQQWARWGGAGGGGGGPGATGQR